jgi:hypothetical protein
MPDNHFQQLVSECQTVLAILGHPSHGNSELRLVSKDTLAAIARRKDFVGLIGVAGMTPRTALAVELNDRDIAVLMKQFTRLMEAAITVVEEQYRGWN